MGVATLPFQVFQGRVEARGALPNPARI